MRDLSRTSSLAAPEMSTGKICGLCQSFHGLLTTFEKALNSQRVQTAKQRRKDDPGVIFQDLRDDKPMPVQMLVDHEQSVVAELDESESAAITTHDVP